MKSKELISIIVPIYNGEKWIERCILSILNQSYNNIELLLIDDCSTDASWLICEKYCSQKKNTIKTIRLFSMDKNSGVSAARNLGVSEAKGEYICFVDADDVLHKDFVLILYSLLKKTNSDIAICKVKEFRDISKINVNKNMNQEIQYECVQRDELLRRGYTCMPHITSTVWARILKRDIMGNLFFPRGIRFEDTAISYKVLDRIEKGIIVDNALYFYFQHEDSFMTQLKKMEDIDKQIDQLSKVQDDIFEYWKNKKESEMFELSMCRHLNWLINFYYELPKQKRKKEYSIINRYKKVYALYKKHKKKDSKIELMVFYYYPEGYKCYSKIIKILKEIKWFIYGICHGIKKRLRRLF